MTNSNDFESRTPDYGPDVLAQLNDELLGLSRTEDQTADEVREADSTLPQLLVGLTSVYGDNVQRAVDLFFEKDEPLDADHRTRLVAALEPTLRDRRLRHGPLQLLLRAAREEKGGDVQQVAEAAGIAASLLSAVEESEVAIERSKISPVELASWIRAVAIDTADAIRCLRYTLASSRGDQVFAEDERLELDDAAQQYVDDVYQALLAE